MDILRFITWAVLMMARYILIVYYTIVKKYNDRPMGAIEKQTRNREDGEIDLALLTDGLRAEREQGII